MIPKQRTYFHLAGKSTMKGTERLLRVWQRHPEWPPLIVVQHTSVATCVNAPNIQRKIAYLSDGDLRQLQNESAFHICLSLTEGWGHYIAEAMSAAAVTITVDAKPMNELVTDERGVLVPCRASGTQRLATTFEFDEISLEAIVNRTLMMSDGECRRIGAAARGWFVMNKQSFPRRVACALLQLQDSIDRGIRQPTSA
jgi:glycosyltransferase involved in cell wall biosynthesis